MIPERIGLAPALLQKILEKFATVSEQFVMLLSDVPLLAFGLHQEDAVGAEYNMIDVETGEFEVMEDVVIVREFLQGVGDSLFSFGACVGVGNAFFELEPGVFKRLDKDDIDDCDHGTPQEVTACQQVIPDRYQQQKAKHGQDNSGEHVLVTRVSHGKSAFAC